MPQLYAEGHTILQDQCASVLSQRKHARAIALPLQHMVGRYISDITWVPGT